MSSQIGDTLEFNTGRQYSAEGQPIKATITDIDEGNGYPNYIVRVEDPARNMRIEVETLWFKADAIMALYDNGAYTNV